jgi:hypothetical protein
MNSTGSASSPGRPPARPGHLGPDRVNLPEVCLASMTDEELETYQKKLLELRELLPEDEPKKRIGTVTR